MTWPGTAGFFCVPFKPPRLPEMTTRRFNLIDPQAILWGDNSYNFNQYSI